MARKVVPLRSGVATIPYDHIHIGPAHAVDDGTPGVRLTVNLQDGGRHWYWFNPEDADAVAGFLTKYAAQARLEAALLEEAGDDDE